jgi:hypothetical protein
MRLELRPRQPHLSAKEDTSKESRHPKKAAGLKAQENKIIPTFLRSLAISGRAGSPKTKEPFSLG